MLEAALKILNKIEKNGFKEMGIRKNFYDRPKEDALIMWKHNL